VIDDDGYRPNVGIVICNRQGQVLWARRFGQHYWLRYKLPKRLVRWDTKPVCIGQKQKWFLLQLMCNDADINVQRSSTPEFDGWRWVSFWYPVRQVVSFKRDVYRRVMKEFAGVVMSMQESAGQRNNPAHRRKRG